MDIGMREILIVLGCLIMAVLFIDAYRRVRDHRRSQLGHRVHDEPLSSQQSTLAGFDDDELVEDDLTPVRPLSHRGGPIGHGQLNRAHESSGQSAGQTPRQIRVRISTPKQSDRVEPGSDGSDLFPSKAVESQFKEESTEKAAPLSLDPIESKFASKRKMKEDLLPDLHGKKTDAPIKALLQPALATAPEAGDFYSNRRNSQAAKTARKQQAAQQEAAPSHPEVAGTSQTDEVIVMHVAAGRDDIFDGEVLVQNVLSLNMRHGEMKIFHRYERPEQHKGLLFSMANMVKPGFFELDHMSAFETPGVTFFLTLPCAGGGLYAFDLMVDTARKLSKSLDGELRDETQSVITAQTVEHFRQRVMEFERKQRMLEKTRQIRERNKLFD